MEAFGGRSHSEVGGPGTVYLSNITPNETLRTLIVSNDKRGPSRTYLTSRQDDSSRAYVVTDSHHEVTEYTFERVSLTEKAHLAFESSLDEPVSVKIGYLDGDQSGVFHTDGNYPITIRDSASPFPAGFRVYENTFLSLPEGKTEAPKRNFIINNNMIIMIGICNAPNQSKRC